MDTSILPFRPAAPQSQAAENTSPEIIGYSVEGRPLKVFHFGTGRRNVLIVAGIHGGYEWNTVDLADELIDYVDAHPEIIPQNVTLHILRVLNPDGLAEGYGPKGRSNANGVDLNRNWNAAWSADLSQDCWNILPLSPGPHPGSEPETKALMRFLVLEDIDTMISYHSAALGVFPGGHPPREETLRLAERIASVTDYPYPPLSKGCHYTGTLVDWAVAAGITAVDVELSTHWFTDFDINLEVLKILLGD
jgi:predicted deacylase